MLLQLVRQHNASVTGQNHLMLFKKVTLEFATYIFCHNFQWLFDSISAWKFFSVCFFFCMMIEIKYSVRVCSHDVQRACRALVCFYFCLFLIAANGMKIKTLF